MGAIAFEDLVHGEHPQEWLAPSRTLALAAFALASTLTTVLMNTRILPLPGALPLSSADLALRGTAIVVTVTIAFLLAAQRVRGATAALIVLTALDLGWWGISYVYYRPADTIGAQLRSVPTPNASGRRISASWMWADFPVMQGFEVVPGYLGLIPATTLPADGDAFRLFAGARASLGNDARLTPLDGGMPRARIAPVPGAETTAGSAAVLVDEPGRIVVEALVPGIRRLALTERFDGGWRVYVDGTAARPLRVDGDFLGASIQPGSHRVEFRFQPRSFTIGIALSAVGSLALLIIAMFGGRKL
jgi:hypothetical protein